MCFEKGLSTYQIVCAFSLVFLPNMFMVSCFIVRYLNYGKERVCDRCHLLLLWLLVSGRCSPGVMFHSEQPQMTHQARSTL